MALKTWTRIWLQNGTWSAPGIEFRTAWRTLPHQVTQISPVALPSILPSRCAVSLSHQSSTNDVVPFQSCIQSTRTTRSETFYTWLDYLSSEIHLVEELTDLFTDPMATRIPRSLLKLSSSSVQAQAMRKQKAGCMPEYPFPDVGNRVSSVTSSLVVSLTIGSLGSKLVPC